MATYSTENDPEVGLQLPTGFIMSSKHGFSLAPRSLHESQGREFYVLQTDFIDLAAVRISFAERDQSDFTNITDSTVNKFRKVIYGF